MFEARLGQASLLKKILESLKDLVTDANFDCSATGIALQAMDSSHVSLVSMLLQAEGFENYRCDRGLQLGINLNSMAKLLKCAGNDDSVTLKSKEEGDTINFTFENPSTLPSPFFFLDDCLFSQLTINRTKQDLRIRVEAFGNRCRCSRDSGNRVPGSHQNASCRIPTYMQGPHHAWGHWCDLPLIFPSKIGCCG